MSISDSSIFASKPFKFIVQGTPLYVHAALVAECSGPLDRMINGHLSEAKQGFAVLDDVDEGTFVRFIRWIYTKNYPNTEHTWVETGEENDTPERSETETGLEEVSPSDGLLDAWGNGVESKKKKKKSDDEWKMSTNLKQSFISGYHPWGSGLMRAPRSNVHPEEDYTEVLLSHARLHVFAEKYDIQPLMKLSCQKLHHTLASFTLYPERVGDITTLLKYVYANTAETRDGYEDLRVMLAHYVGTEMDTLITYGKIKDIMLENGEILGDFLRMFAVNFS